MRKIRPWSFCVPFILVLVYCSPARGQAATGTPPYGSFGGGPDVIDLANLNAHITVPVFNKAGRGTPFTYNLTYDTSVLHPVTSGSTTTWQPVNNWGWKGLTEPLAGTLTYQGTTGTCSTGNPHFPGFYSIYKWSYRDTSGVLHTFPGTTAMPITCGNTTSLISTATDGSGFTVSATGMTGNSVTSRAGFLLSGAGTSTTDRNGNQISVNGSNQFTDTLGTTALTISGAPPNPVTYTYTSPQGANAVFTVKYAAFTVLTNFGCSGIAEYSGSNIPLVSEIDLPDGTKYLFTYEATPGHSGDVTGRLASVELPTGGTISYSYSGGSNGIVCADGTAATLTRTTPDGTWTYAHSESGTAWTTTITDPQSNQSVLNFQGIYETERQVYQGSTSGTLLKTTFTCYNGSTPNCNSTAITLPITQRTHYVQWPGGLESETNATYNTYGSVTEKDEYAYGSGSPGSIARKTLTTYASLSNGIVSMPASVTVEDGSSNIKSQTTYTYDQGSVTATSSTPQQVAVSGSRGNATTIAYLVSGSATLSKTFTYYDTGNVNVATDVNGAQTTYSYGTGSCGNSFATSVSEPLSLSRSMTWNCTGGVETSVTDENGKTVSANFTSDLDFWRPNSTSDQESNTTNLTYTGQTSVESSLDFNGTTSTTDILSTVDPLGRAHVSQVKESPSSSTYDSVETDYDSSGRPDRTTLPYAGAAGATNSSAPSKNTTYDALGRKLTFTDSGGRDVTFSYSQNDSSRTLGPAPTGENTKRKQFEYDGLGRLTSVCEITSGTGSGTCGQISPVTGYWTQYTYDVLNDLTGVTQNAQSTSQKQNRTYVYDDSGRLTSETNPESGTTAYVYDMDATCGTSKGDLVKKTDPVGDTICYAYDALHRVTSVTFPSGSYSSVTPSKYFVYDSAIVNSVAMTNAKGRLAEAYTCTSCPSKLTDIGISYTARGEASDLYESTPNSGLYNHVSQTYWANGAPDALSAQHGTSSITGLPTITYGVDGEGRVSTASASSGQNPLSSTTYSVASLPTQVNLGSSDSDAFTYDPNTNRMTKYQVSVNGQSVVGSLTWNDIGTLEDLSVTDAFYSVGNQSCAYTHDDLARIAEVNCGSAWLQNFSYDAFGNISKSGSVSFQPTYSYATNRMTEIGSSTPTYDANGNVTNDFLHTYTWDANGRPVTIDGVSVTYDALGRMVERNNGTYTQIVYTPSGAKLAIMSGSALQKAFVPLPGGSAAVYNASGLAYYRHSDWLGSSRFASTPSRAMYYDGAYGPFGELYAQTGTTDVSFTGMNQDTVANLYDFPAREYGTQGRWPSPDPSGISAVRPTDPRTWNRYAYVRNNPLAAVDPQGLVDVMPGTLIAGAIDFYGENAASAMGCMMDGVDTPCSMADSALQAGGAAQCPNNNCVIVSDNNRLEYFWASTNGSGNYYAYSGPGALYYSANAAVIAAFQYIFGSDPNSASGNMRYEYGGTVAEDANDVFSFTDPVATQAGGCTIDTTCTYDQPADVPPGTVALFHSHPFGGGFSTGILGGTSVSGDIPAANVLGLPSYIGNPEGCIEYYNPSGGQGVLQGGQPGSCP